MAKEANSTASVSVDAATDSIDGEIVSITPAGVTVYYRIPRTQRYETRLIPRAALVGFEGNEGEAGSVEFKVRSIESSLEPEGTMRWDEDLGLLVFEGETTTYINPENCDLEISTEDTGSKKKGKKGKEEKKKAKKEKGKRVGKRSKDDDDEEDAEDEDD